MKRVLMVAPLFVALGCTKFKTSLTDGGTESGLADHAGGGAGGAAGGSGGGGAGLDASSDARDATSTGGAGPGGADGGGGSAGAAGSGGAAGAGGVAGSGGAPGLTLGQGCQGDGQCASGHCAGGVCCDQTCAGPCAQCNSSGHCQMPADDPACGTVACPADTACRDYATSITTNRCKAIGQCKAAADCTFVNQPAKTFCGLASPQQDPSAALVCDGAGNCGSPTVDCGADGACPVNPGVCCVRSGTTCMAANNPPCGGPNGGVALTCDETADCPPNYVCCLFSGPNGAGNGCVTTCASSGLVVETQICNPNVPGECRTGTCQANSPGPPNYLCK